MFRSTLPVKWILGACAVVSLTQCGGGKSESQKVTLNTIPKEPIVITADVTRGTETVKAPWAKFRVNMANDSDKKLIIVALTAKVYSAYTPQPGIWAVDPSTVTGSGTAVDCIFNSYGSWDPGQEKEFGVLDTAQPATCSFGIVYFTIENMPKVENQTSFRYRVELTPIGYFVDSDGEESGRFTRSLTFYTR